MLSRELIVALTSATDAARLVMQVYRSAFKVEYKSRNDPVTSADRLANECIVNALRSAFPGDGICAEEGSLEESSAAAARGGRCWFVDPLDGTREFVARNGEFCVMVGLAIDGVATLGVIVAPVWNRVFWGDVESGAYERGADGVDAHMSLPSPPNDLSQVRLVVSRSHRDSTVESVARRFGIRDERPCGSVGLKAALVSCGEADLYMHGMRGPKLWDGCAPEAIARAAGAAVSDWTGRPLRYDTHHLPLEHGILVAHAQLHARAVAAVASS